MSTIRATKAVLILVTLGPLLMCLVDEGLASIGPSGGPVSSVAIDPKAPSTIYVGTRGGVFKSTEGGKSWSRFNTGLTNLEVQSLAIDPSDSNTIYAITVGWGENAIVKSTDGGERWSLVLPGAFWSLVTDPYVSNILYAGGSAGTNHGSFYYRTNRHRWLGPLWQLNCWTLTPLAVLASGTSRHFPHTSPFSILCRKALHSSEALAK